MKKYSCARTPSQLQQQTEAVLDFFNKPFPKLFNCISLSLMQNLCSCDYLAVQRSYNLEDSHITVEVLATVLLGDNIINTLQWRWPQILNWICLWKLANTDRNGTSSNIMTAVKGWYRYTLQCSKCHYWLWWILD